MDRLYTQELRRLHRELDSTLTPKQRQLLAVGALSEKMCTPQQIEILKRMEPYLAGLTPEQSRHLGVLDTFAEGYEAGQKSGHKLGMVIAVLVIAFIIVGFLALISR